MDACSDSRDFDRLTRMYSRELHSCAYRLCRDRALCEDLVQETFARAWSARRGLRKPRAARYWLYTILRHEHARLFERKRFDMVDDVDLDAVRDERLAELERARAVREALGSLPAGYGTPLALQVLGGFTCDEIAQVMHCSPGAVMTRLSRARRALREIVETPASALS